VHWKVFIWPREEIAPNTPVEVILTGVVNPEANSGGAYYFAAGHADGTGKYIAFVESVSGSATVVANTARVIQFNEISTTPSDLTSKSTADYSFKMYMIANFSLTSVMRVVFPRQYDLYLLRTATSYSCTTTYKDESRGSVDVDKEQWNESATCTAFRNTIEMSSPSAT
jgi:hypothetical protein